MKTRIVLTLFALLLVAAPAQALNWGLGADLGYTLFMPADKYDAENVSAIGIPFSAVRVGELSFVAPAGGLRVSFTGEKPMHEVWLGLALNRYGEDELSVSVMQLSGNYQFNFDVQSAIKPYLTAGVGLNRAGYSDDDDSDSATAAYFGGGVGAACELGPGRLRGEIRYDALGEATIGDGDYVVFPEGGALGFKLGFDLWAK